MKLKYLEKLVINALVFCVFSGITIIFTFITWNYINPITPIEKSINIFGSILTLWCVIYILFKEK